MSKVRKISKRWYLVLLVNTSQLICMLIALWCFSNWLEVELSQMVREVVHTNNQQIASRVAASIENLSYAEVAREHPPNAHGITDAVNGAVTQTRGAGVMMTLLLAFIGCALLTTIVLRYENRLATINSNLENVVEERTRALVKTRDAIIYGLAKLAEWRDDATGGHLDRIHAYVMILGKQLSSRYPELDEETIKMIGFTSSLHDIGKVGIPDTVLLKPGPLTYEEREVIERHPLIGGNCLLAIKERIGADELIQTACEIALFHHERWDGGGYPHGLAGENIPLTARIVALADVYDALTCRRVYKDAMSHEDARRIIVEGSGSHFDPEVVQAFLACEAHFRALIPPVDEIEENAVVKAARIAVAQA